MGQSKKKKTDKVKLTPKQEIFISEYLHNGFNATQAAIKAGYSKKTAPEIGKENLQKPYIQEAIKNKIQEILSNKDELIFKVVEEYKRLGLADIREFVEYDENGVNIKPSSEVDTRPISEITITEKKLKAGSKKEKKNDVLEREIKFKMHSKVKALEGLSRYLSLFNDKVDLGEKTLDSFAEWVKSIHKKDKE